MDEYARIVLISRENEPSENFNRRLIALWSYMLRAHPGQYEKVYAESAAIDEVGTRLHREYLVAAEILAEIEKALAIHEMAYEPIDADDLYSKFEAAPPNWFLVPH